MNNVSAITTRNDNADEARRGIEKFAKGLFQGRCVQIIKRDDIEAHMPASHSDNSGSGGTASAFGGTGFCQAVTCVAVIFAVVGGPLMWGMGSAYCDEPTFKGWGDSACDVQNFGAFVTIAAAVSISVEAAICCICLPIFASILCCGVVAASEQRRSASTHRNFMNQMQL